MILKDFFTSFIVESKILRNHWLRNYFVKLVDRGECKIIGTRLTMFGCRIVKFLHKRTCRICSLLAFGELASGGFFHWLNIIRMFNIKQECNQMYQKNSKIWSTNVDCVGSTHRWFITQSYRECYDKPNL
jgi:hypothetical protein